MAMAPSSWSGRHRGRVDAFADQGDILGHAERRPVVEDDHRDLFGRRVHAERHRRRRRRADDVRLADQPKQVRDVPAAAPFDVVGVDRSPRDGGDCLFELGGFVEPVGVQRDGDVVGIGEAQDMVDELGVRAVVLVDLEAACARIDQRLERRVVLRPGHGLQPDVDRPSATAGAV